MTTALTDLLRGAPVDQLVPGDPDRTDQLAQSMLRYSELFADAARALGRIDMLWTGEAAAAFRGEFGLQPAAFTAAATAFDQAGYALGSHALTLDSVRLAAAQAVDMFEEGMCEARLARAALDPTTAGAPSAVLDSGLITEPAGSTKRLAAVEKLDRARADVRASGARAAAALRTAVEGAPEEIPGWVHAVNFFTAAPWDINEERREWAAGGAVGTLDLVMTAGAGPTAIFTMPTFNKVVNDLEWQHGIDTGSGWHTSGAIVVPAVLTAGLGASEVLAARGAAQLTRGAARGIARTEAEAYAAALRASPEGTPTVASVAVDMRTGRVYYGVSAEKVDIPTELSVRLPQDSQTRWSVTNCGEVAAASRAVQDGANLDDLGTLGPCRVES